MSVYLFDTHLLLWAAGRSPKLSRRATGLINDLSNTVLFSAVTIAEVAIKFAQGRADFTIDPRALWAGSLANGYQELPFTGNQATRLLSLPNIHKDPWDRLLVAQALAEGVPLVTADALLARYPGQIILV